LKPDDKNVYEKKGETLLALYPFIPPRKKEQKNELD
jgi:hypothetical protein